MKLEIGMYVRLDRCQGIRKIDEYDEDIKRYYLDGDIYDDFGDQICTIEDEKDILKSSHNIIDLIEVGDYVNGYLVLNVLDFNDNTRILSLEKIYNYNITEDDIKSIVTKEQFENMKYRVD